MLNSVRSQDHYVTLSDNIPVMVGKVQAQKWPIKQQTHRKINVQSNWSDSDNDKDSQTRGKPIVYDITSDQETDMHQQPITSALLRRPNTWPKVLTCGRGGGKLHNSRYDISQAPPLLNNQEPIAERNLTVVAPTDRVQTYE